MGQEGAPKFPQNQNSKCISVCAWVGLELEMSSGLWGREVRQNFPKTEIFAEFLFAPGFCVGAALESVGQGGVESSFQGGRISQTGPRFEGLRDPGFWDF